MGVAINLGNGAFTSARISYVPGARDFFGDFNEDQKIDVLADNGFYPGLGDGRFSSQRVSAGSLTISPQSVLDGNNDGHFDATTAILGCGGNSQFMTGTSTGITFGSAFYTTDPSIRSGEFNNDNIVDFYTTSCSGTTVNLQRSSNGAWTAAPIDRTSILQLVGIGDTNGDGLDDVVSTDRT